VFFWFLMLAASLLVLCCSYRQIRLTSRCAPMTMPRQNYFSVEELQARVVTPVTRYGRMLRLARYTKHGGERVSLPDLLEPGGARPRVFREERLGSNSTGTPV